MQTLPNIYVLTLTLTTPLLFIHDATAEDVDICGNLPSAQPSDYKCCEGNSHWPTFAPERVVQRQQSVASSSGIDIFADCTVIAGDLEIRAAITTATMYDHGATWHCTEQGEMVSDDSNDVSAYQVTDLSALSKLAEIQGALKLCN